MTAIASQTDKVIPCYFDRTICFDLPLTGAIAVKNLLLNLRSHVPKPAYTTASNLLVSNSVSGPVAFSMNSQKVNKAGSFNTKNLQSLLNLSSYNSQSFETIELIIRQIQAKILVLNQQISHYEDFLKFRAFFVTQKSQNQILNKQSKKQTLYKTFRKLENLRAIRANAFRRLKLLRPFQKQNIRPEWMVLEVLPVLPPDLRPILVLDSQQVAVSDLNKLYQKVIFRNERLKRLYNDFYSLNFSPEMRYAQRLLQEAVDALIENGKGDSNPITASNNRQLKSLSDMVKGKKGRFRQNLLGKRVDYSGRSVIVVGPQLKLYECGLPQEMAIELFQPFLIRYLINKKISRNFISAKKLIKSKAQIIIEVLKQVMENRPILLNRAPTLHRLGIQAFKPKLVAGRAILLHPLVCSAYNADFDGDQMAVHVPLSHQACSEAWKLMWGRNNILSPATGEPIIIPSQDMVLGCYYLTTLDKIKRSNTLISNYNVGQSNQTKMQTSKILSDPGVKSNRKTENFTAESFSFSPGLTNSLLNSQKRSSSFTLTPHWSQFNNIDQVIQLFSQQFLNCHTPIWLKWSEHVEFQIQKQKCLEIQIDKW